MLILVDCKKKRMRNKTKSAQKNWSFSGYTVTCTVKDNSEVKLPAI